MGYFTGAIKNHSRAVSHRNYFACFTGTIDHAPQIFMGVFWRDRARFLTFTVYYAFCTQLQLQT
jgi:hypothetical protein